MSRILALMFFLALTLVAPNSAQAKMKVFACFPEWEALVKQLGGDKVERWSSVDRKSGWCRF
jgi:zinc/manganese transport system substrate-binding protein